MLRVNNSCYFLIYHHALGFKFFSRFYNANIKWLHSILEVSIFLYKQNQLTDQVGEKKATYKLCHGRLDF